MLVKPPQSSNALSPILVTPLGIVMLVKLLQPPNATSPIVVTPLGIVNAPVKPLQPENAKSTILVTPLGIILLLQPNINRLSDLRITQFPSDLYMLFPVDTVMLVKPLQLPNAYSLIVVTLFGIVMLVKPLQP
jgi:hypothetical protein